MLAKPIPAIHQMGYVVRDMQAALDHWTKVMHVGPFFLNADAPLLDATYLGKKTHGKLDIASSCLGGMQIELIAVKDREPSAFRDFLDRGYEGLQHIGYMTDRYDETYAACLAAGMTLVQHGESVLDSSTRWCYMAPNAPVGAMVEIIGLGPRKRRLFDAIAEAAAKWDGLDPVRPLPKV